MVVYGFSIADGNIREETDAWRHYDWGVLTHLGWNTRPAFVGAARRAGANVELNAGPVAHLLTHPGKRTAWVAATLARALNQSASGVNFDLEDPMALGTAEARGYTALVSETANAFHLAIPGSSVSVDVPWSPFDVDGRNYDWRGLGLAADLLFIMAYDTQSQVYGRCIAQANSPYDAVRKSVRQWLEFAPPRKLVLGLPWYVYDYPCEPGPDGAPAPPDTDACRLASVPFRGVACSDAAGVQRDYAEAMRLVHQGRNNTPVRWDDTQQTPFFNYRDEQGLTRQVWFDDPRSLAAKYGVATEHGLGGIGMWHLDGLEYGSQEEEVAKETAAMWAVLADAAASGSLPAS